MINPTPQKERQNFPFKKGEIICRDRMGRPLLVTAVGAKRFLYVSICISARQESVAMKRNYQDKFRKWDPSKYPDSQYSYIAEAKFDKWNILNGIKIKFPKVKKLGGGE